MTNQGKRQRLDLRCVDLGLATSRQRAQALILAGEIFVDGEKMTKAGTAILTSATVEHRGLGMPYVSRGGLKLAGALNGFAIDPRGSVVLDIGAATGGFTDCLLQNGARHVYAIDVGYGQLAWKLRQDKRVTVLERMNFRNASTAQLAARSPAKDLWPATMATIDVSFISLTILLPVLASILPAESPILALVKPQFEAGRQDASRTAGVIQDDTIRRAAIRKVIEWAERHAFRLVGAMDAPIRGPKGNLEHWLHLHTPAHGA